MRVLNPIHGVMAVVVVVVLDAIGAVGVAGMGARAMVGTVAPISSTRGRVVSW